MARFVGCGGGWIFPFKEGFKGLEGKHFNVLFPFLTKPSLAAELSTWEPNLIFVHFL